MRTTQLSLDRRGQLLTGGALIAMMLLAACDNDRPTAPVTAAPASAVLGAALTRGQSLSWIVLEENNARVPLLGSKFTVTGPNSFKLTLTDNDANDRNANIGEFLVAPVGAGFYWVCQDASAPGFRMPPVPCKSTTVAGPTTIGPFFNPRYPRLIWEITDEVGNYIAGTQFGIADSIGTFGVNDNGPHDSNALAGVYDFRLLWRDGQLELCQKWTPAPFVLPAGGGCVKFLAHYGLTTDMGTIINVRPYSANWGVTDGNLDASNNYVPLAGAKFKVTFPFGLGSMQVVDDGVDDYDKRPGRIAVQLPAAGSYLICETQAPPNHWMSKRSCNTQNVAYAVPSAAGWFINPEAQVPSFNGAR